MVHHVLDCLILTICKLPLLLSRYVSRIIVGIYKNHSIDSANCWRTGPSDDSDYCFDRNRDIVRRLGRSLGSGSGIDVDLQEAETRDAG